MATIIVNGQIYEESVASTAQIVVGGTIFEDVVAAGGGVSVSPSPLQNLTKQFSPIDAASLDGALQ